MAKAKNRDLEKNVWGQINFSIAFPKLFSLKSFNEEELRIILNNSLGNGKKQKRCHALRAASDNTKYVINKFIETYSDMFIIERKDDGKKILFTVKDPCEKIDTIKEEETITMKDENKIEIEPSKEYVQICRLAAFWGSKMSQVFSSSKETGEIIPGKVPSEYYKEYVEELHLGEFKFKELNIVLEKIGVNPIKCIPGRKASYFWENYPEVSNLLMICPKFPSEEIEAIDRYIKSGTEFGEIPEFKKAEEEVISEPESEIQEKKEAVPVENKEKRKSILYLELLAGLLLMKEALKIEDLIKELENSFGITVTPKDIFLENINLFFKNLQSDLRVKVEDNKISFNTDDMAYTRGELVSILNAIYPNLPENLQKRITEYLFVITEEKVEEKVEVEKEIKEKVEEVVVVEPWKKALILETTSFLGETLVVNKIVEKLKKFRNVNFSYLEVSEVLKTLAREVGAEIKHEICSFSKEQIKDLKEKYKISNYTENIFVSSTLPKFKIQELFGDYLKYTFLWEMNGVVNYKLTISRSLRDEEYLKNLLKLEELGIIKMEDSEIIRSWIPAIIQKQSSVLEERIRMIE